MKVTAKRTTGQRFVPAVAAGVIALALSGCGEEPQPKPAPETAPPPATKAPAPVTKAPAAPTAKDRRAEREKWEARFRSADKNYDGGLSRKELEQRKGFADIKKQFGKMDTNRDGKVTIAERDAWHDKRAARRQ